MTATNSQIPQHATSHLPIVIAGGGCVGLFLALLLAQSDIPNSIIVVEPEHADITSTRAMAHQPIIYPLFARANLMPELSRLGSFANGICFRTSVANGSKLIAGKQFDLAKGEKGQLLLPQGKFQDLLLRKLKEMEKRKVKVQMGWKVVGFTEKEEGRVDVKIQDEQGKQEVMKAEYLVGADGAKSAVRKTMDVSFKGETLDSHLVATDIMYDFHEHGFYDANFIIDAENYGLVGRINNDGMWRVSYGVPGNTSEEEIYRTVEEKLREMLPKENGKKLDFEVKQVAPYKSQQRYAETFWRGRVGLCGDAAHLTNPYAGLGLASGIADASALADVLIRVLSNQASDSARLLDSWSNARLQKFLTVVDKPSRMALNRVKSKVDSDGELEAFLSRDPLVGSLKMGMPVMPPSLETKGEELEGW